MAEEGVGCSSVAGRPSSRRGELPQVQSAIRRAAVPVLYAHWEGFIKHTADAYLKYVSRRRLPYSVLVDGLAALRVETILLDSSGPSRRQRYRQVVEFLRSDSGPRFAKSKSAHIDTESNLSSSVLRDIVETLGLDYAAFEPNKDVIDKNLLASRNSIAHGEYHPVKEGDYADLQSAVVGMMDEFYQQVLKAVGEKGYLRDVATQG